MPFVVACVAVVSTALSAAGLRKPISALRHVVKDTATLDRLLHHSRILPIRDDSYRLREKRRSGLFKAAQATAFAAPPK